MAFSGVTVKQKLIVRSEPLGGNHLTRDDFDWNQSSTPSVTPVREVSYLAMNSCEKGCQIAEEF